MKKNVKVFDYKSGAKLIVEKNDKADFVAFVINVQVGSIDENEKQFGLAHFLEHLFFKSTKDMSTFEIAEYLESLGAVINADTSESKTNYHFISLKENFEKCVEMFSKMFFEGAFKHEEIEKERDVVLEEYKRTLDNSHRISMINAYKNLVKGTPYEHDVIGTEEVIKNVTREEILEFRKKYTPDKIIFSIAGNIDYDEAKNIVEKYFSKILDCKFEPEESNEIVIKDVENNFVFHKKDENQSKIYILFKSESIYSDEVNPLMLLSVICGVGMCSRFFNELREKLGLAYSCGASTFFAKEFGYFQIFIATSNEKVGSALINIKKILNEISENGVYQHELEIAKTKFKADYVYGMNSVSRQAKNNAKKYHYFKNIPSFEEKMEEIESVTLEDVKKCAKKLFNSKNYVVSVCGNLESVEDIKNAFN